ncbi:hypothetical protein [Streptomyces coeruleofuscus]
MTTTRPTRPPPLTAKTQLTKIPGRTQGKKTYVVARAGGTMT